jgi:D-sedoheptulose 7-phosphate isomerase
MSFFNQYQSRLNELLTAVEVTDREGNDLGADHGFALLLNFTRALHQHDRGLFLAGNGASAAMASHMALDFAKNGRVRAMAFNDAASLTALGNDLGYDHVFDQPIRWYGRSGDMLAAISSSGASPNILNAIEVARQLGLRIITFTGLNADNPCREQGDINFYLDAKSYGLVECGHQVLLHAWLDQFLGQAEWAMAEAQNMRITV